MAARQRDISPDEVIITRHGWEAIRVALSRLQEITAQLATDIAAGRTPSQDYARAVGALGAAVAELQEASEPRAAW